MALTEMAIKHLKTKAKLYRVWVTADQFKEEKAKAAGIIVADDSIITASQEDLLDTRAKQAFAFPILTIPRKDRLEYIEQKILAKAGDDLHRGGKRTEPMPRNGGWAENM